MSALKFCPGCGSKILPQDRFCNDCGYTISNAGEINMPVQAGNAAPLPAASPPHANIRPPVSANQPVAPSTAVPKNPAPKTALIIVASVLMVAFLGGGGIYWWLSRDKAPDLASTNSKTSGSQQTSTATEANPVTGNVLPNASLPVSSAVDLQRASAYLPEPGLSCRFNASYPDGMSATVERVSARVVPAEAVRVSEVEITTADGTTAGYGFHYVERADGIYCVYDQTPYEIFPVLKNQLSVGQTWSQQDEFGRVVWKVVDTGATLNLGFATLKNCLLVEEDNQAVGMKTYTYYAPGMGRVAVKSSPQGEDYLKLTAFSRIDAARAAETVKKWAPNYNEIKDDPAR